MAGIRLVKSMLDDRAFLLKTAAIAIPIAAQALLNNVLNFLDTLMIGQLGETTISAVGLANKVFFVASLIVFGICSGSSILSSQFWGIQDKRNIKRVQGMALILAVVCAMIFTVASLVSPQFVMGIFTDSEETIKIGADYLFFVCLSYPISAVTQIYISILRSVNEVKVPVVISTIAIVVNVALNYLLIFGKFGFPELGVIGAALATLIARIVECGALLLIVYHQKGPCASRFSEMLGFDRPFVKMYFGTVTMVIINEAMWSIGVTMYALVYGRMGDDAVAAITVTQSIEQILQVVFMGVASAAAIILGNELGAGKLKEAKRHAKYLLVLQFSMTLVIAAICLMLKGPIISLFHVSDAVKESINLCFYVYLGFIIFRVFNLVNIVGILRSGGDTKAALLLDVIGVWLVAVPLAYLGGIVLHLPIYLVYAMVNVEELFKFIFGFPRYIKNKWCRNLITGETAE